MIAALSLAVPVYVIGWSHKYQEILQFFKMDEFMRDYRNIDANEIASDITREIQAENELRKRINIALPEVMSSSLIQFDEMRVDFCEEE